VSSPADPVSIPRRSRGATARDASRAHVPVNSAGPAGPEAQSQRTRSSASPAFLEAAERSFDMPGRDGVVHRMSSPHPRRRSRRGRRSTQLSDQDQTQGLDLRTANRRRQITTAHNDTRNQATTAPRRAPNRSNADVGITPTMPTSRLCRLGPVPPCGVTRFGRTGSA
jgi:hypothetical protein